MKWIIYKHTLLIGPHKGWSYIGQTFNKPNIRWHTDGSGYKSCTAFFRAIKKYGWDNFSHEILETVSSIEEADEREQYWIAYYHTWVFDKNRAGYNMTKGGSGNKSICTEETRKKISASVKANYDAGIFISPAKGKPGSFLGKKHSIDTKQKMSEIAKLQYKNGRVNPNKNKPMSAEQKEKIRQANTGFKVSEQTKQKLSIKTSNTRWVYKIGEKAIKIKADDLEYYLSIGYIQGRGKRK